MSGGQTPISDSFRRRGKRKILPPLLLHAALPGMLTPLTQWVRFFSTRKSCEASNVFEALQMFWCGCRSPLAVLEKHVAMAAAGTDDAAWALWCAVAPHSCPDWLSMMVPLPAAGVKVRWTIGHD